MSREVRLRYFAWVRERVGVGEERLMLPDTVRTAGELIDWLAGQGDNYAYALEARAAIRVAADQEHVDHDEDITSARDIALFPPMTGG
jgi:molybdopterin synthase sulfur carrier subunit